MIISEKIIQQLSEKYKLDFKKFKYIEKKKFFNKKILVIYFNEEYFFEIDSEKKSKNNYFPYFVTEKNLNTFERWIKSIFLTENKNKKIVRNLEDGITERKELKKKYNI